MFYILKHSHNSVDSFEILHLDVACFMWKRVHWQAYSRAYMENFHAHACCLKFTGIQWQNQWSWKQKTFLYASYSFDCFSNVCTFQNTFEDSQDVRAECKLVDISYWCFSTKTSWNWCATSRSYRKEYVRTRFCNLWCILILYKPFYFSWCL